MHKTVCVRTHGKRADEVQSKQRRAAKYESHCFNARRVTLALGKASSSVKLFLQSEES